MKKIFFKMIVLLLCISIVGVVLNAWGQTMLISAIEDVLYERDIAYVDQFFDKFNVVISLVGGEVQKNATIKEDALPEISKYHLNNLRDQLNAEQVYLLDENYSIIISTESAVKLNPVPLLIENNQGNFSTEITSNIFGYYLDTEGHKIKIVTQQYFQSSGVHILEVYDLVQMMLIHYPVSVYESLYPYLLNANSEFIDENTQFAVDFILPNALERTKKVHNISNLEVGKSTSIKSDELTIVYQLSMLDHVKWLERPLMIKKITYENSKLSQLYKKMLIFIVVIILLLIVMALVVYYVVIYKGLMKKMVLLNQELVFYKTSVDDFKISETGIMEIDSIVKAYQSIKLRLIDRENFIAEMGYFDTITGVGNVYLLEKDLNRLIKIVDENEYLSLISIHLKNDREIVDQLSNENIQMFLTTFMTQIKTSFGSDAVYRTSDYTFAALSHLNNEYGVINQIQHLQENIKKLPLNNEIKLKIVVAKYPDHGLSSLELLNNIEIASQSDSGQSVIFYSQKLKEIYLKQLELETALKSALKNNEIYVVYQPVVDPISYKIVGVEALARWRRKDGKFISPEIFIPMAERLGIIEAIDKTIFEKSCRMLLLWEEIFKDDFFVSINVSPIWFTSPDFIKFTHNTITKIGVDPARICLEIIETCLIEDINQANGIILDVQNLGVKIALDDFGKGYSSLNYLRNLQIDKLKIDKDFLLEMDFESQEYNLIDAIVEMAHHMKFEVVVEGVEEIAQLEYLKALNVEMVQGYLFSKPVDKKEISQLLLEGGNIKLMGDV